MEECLACNLASGKLELPGGRIYDTPHWVVEHCVGPLGLGTLIVKPFRHCTSVRELTDEEVQELGPLLRRVAATIHAILNPDQVYVCLWSHAGWKPGHIHFVLQPSWNHLQREHPRPGPYLQVDMFDANGRPPREQVEAFAAKAREVIRTVCINAASPDKSDSPMSSRKEFRVRHLKESDHDWVGRLLRENWGSTSVISRARIHHADELPGFVSVHEGRPAGLVTYEIDGDECEIVTLNSLENEVGIGSALLQAVRKAAIAASCRRIWLIATNDNTAALRFYQKRGFSLVAVYPNALEKSRQLKPEIPSVGMDGIPIRDEIGLEMLL